MNSDIPQCKIVGNKETLHFHIEFKDSNASSAMDHINLTIIVNSVGVAKPTTN